jgi:hypothetical protein
VTAVFENKPDTDTDGLSDDWEQQIIDADPNDGITTINDVNPNDDFDGDGLTNDEEFWNRTDPTATTEVIATITTSAPDVQWMTHFRMDLQLRFRGDNQAAKLVRRVTVLADGGATFGLPATRVIHKGTVYQNSPFPRRIYAETNASGQFSADAQGSRGGQIATDCLSCRTS